MKQIRTAVCGVDWSEVEMLHGGGGCVVKYPTGAAFRNIA